MSKIRALFSNFWKRAGKTSLPPPSSYAPAPSTFLSKFSSDMYLSRIINYWGRIFTLYLTWGAFNLVWVLSIIFFFIIFFLLISVFSLTDTNDSQDSREQRGNHYSSCFPLPLAHECSFSSSRFLPFFFNRSVWNYQIDCWWDLFSLEICILFAFSLRQISRSYWLSHFKVTLWGFELISNYHPSITKRTA